jgi:hypothetical protein
VSKAKLSGANTPSSLLVSLASHPNHQLSHSLSVDATFWTVWSTLLAPLVFRSYCAAAFLDGPSKLASVTGIRRIDPQQTATFVQNSTLSIQNRSVQIWEISSMTSILVDIEDV